MKIFLSVGATYNEQQESFVQSFEKFLIHNSCEKLTVGRGNYYSSQPISSAKELMYKADGVVVIAFTRTIVKSAFEKPNSEQQEELNNKMYPTIWNQLEAAMAFGLSLPLLMIIEKGLMQEAMLKDRLEYRALVTDLNADFFNSEEFKGIFLDWKDKIEEKKKNTNVDVKSLTIGTIFKSLTPGDLKKIIASITGILVAIVSAAFWFGKKFGT